MTCATCLNIPPVFFRWIVDMEGAPGTLYEGEKFQLLFKFSSRYPFDSPQVSARGSASLAQNTEQFSLLCLLFSFIYSSKPKRPVQNKVSKLDMKSLLFQPRGLLAIVARRNICSATVCRNESGYRRRRSRETTAHSS